MPELLFEIFSEETPAMAQTKAVDNIKAIFDEQATKLNITYTKLYAYSTPRRLVLAVENLQKNSGSDSEEKRGPRTDAPEAALNGFLRANNLTKDQLTIKGQFYYAIIKKEEIDLENSLIKIIKYIFGNLAWPKTMRWEDSNTSWIRPIRNILCYFDHKVLPISFAGLTANNISYGHRFMANKAFEVQNFTDYQAKLLAHKVILDQNERVNEIISQSNEIANKLGLVLIKDMGLIEEIAALVEYPIALYGQIDTKFLQVPNEVLINTMKSHQRYLTLTDSDNNFAPYFIVVANVSTQDMNEIVSGNEKVLNARLEDAKFFYDQDRRTKLASRLETLKQITFHAKLGSVYDKTQRIIELSKLISAQLKISPELVTRTAMLSKCDLPTNLVIEFPELQGVIGKYYALNDQEPKDVAIGILEHYLPIGRNDICPRGSEGAIVSIADKLDTIVGMFFANEPPTSSKDPYALRRSALGIIRIILEHGFNLDLTDLVARSLGLYIRMGKDEISGQARDDAAGAIDKATLSCHPDESQDLIQKHDYKQKDIVVFLHDRFKFFLKESFRHDLVTAGLRDGDLNILEIYNKISELKNFAESAEGKLALTALKRVSNFIDATPGQARDDATEAVNDAAGTRDNNDPQTALELAVQNLPNIIFLKDLLAIYNKINYFCDNVTIMDADLELRKNRLALLQKIHSKFFTLANFSAIEL